MGAVDSPSITIGGKIHKVNVSVATGEYVKVVSDGTTKTITLIKSRGFALALLYIIMLNTKTDCKDSK